MAKFVDSKYDDPFEVMLQNLTGGFKYDRSTGQSLALENTLTADKVEPFSYAGVATRILERALSTGRLRTIGLNGIYLGGGRPMLAFDRGSPQLRRARRASKDARKRYLFDDEGYVVWEGTAKALFARKIRHLEAMAISPQFNRQFSSVGQEKRDLRDALRENGFTEKKITTILAAKMQRRAGGIYKFYTTFTNYRRDIGTALTHEESEIYSEIRADLDL